MKRTWVFGIVCTILIILLVGYNLRLQREIALHEAHSNLTSLVNSVEIDLKRAFFSLDQVFLGLENYLGLYAAQRVVAPPQIRRVIDNLILQNDYLTALVVIDADGQVLYWNNNIEKPNLGKREYFLVHTREQFDGLYLGSPQESILNKGQWIFGISKALRRESGSLVNVLNAIVDVKYFYHQYQGLLNQSDNTLIISSPEGVVYTQIPNHEENVGKKLAYTLVPDDIGSHTQQIIDGKVHLTHQRRLVNYPLVVSASMPVERALSAWYRNAWASVFISALACSALMFLTYRAAAYQKNEEKIKDKFQRQAITDSLTGLFNRRYALEEAQKEIKKAQRSDIPLALGLLDLDYFKKVNDLYGHQAGDEILVGVAKLLKANCRESDVISRFGGEEFLLLFPATDLEGAIASAQKICDSLAQKTFKTSIANIKITASIGITQWGNDETDINGALRRADDALYQVKKAGRNGVKWLPHSTKNKKKSHSIWIGQRLE